MFWYENNDGYRTPAHNISIIATPSGVYYLFSTHDCFGRPTARAASYPSGIVANEEFGAMLRYEDLGE